MRKGCASPGVWGSSSASRSKSSAFAPLMGLGSRTLFSLVGFEAPLGRVGSRIGNRAGLLLVVPLDLRVVEGHSLLRLAATAATDGNRRHQGVAHGVDEDRVDLAIFVLPDSDFDGSQRFGLVAVVNQLGGGQVYILGDVKFLVIGLARGTFLVALVAGDLLRDSVAERKDFNLVLVAVKS